MKTVEIVLQKNDKRRKGESNGCSTCLEYISEHPGMLISTPSILWIQTKAWVSRETMIKISTALACFPVCRTKGSKGTLLGLIGSNLKSTQSLLRTSSFSFCQFFHIRQPALDCCIFQVVPGLMLVTVQSDKTSHTCSKGADCHLQLHRIRKDRWNTFYHHNTSFVFEH